MSLVQQFQLMGDYNCWMNQQLFQAASTLLPPLKSQHAKDPTDTILEFQHDLYVIGTRLMPED